MRGKIITDCSARTHCDSHAELFAKIKPPPLRVFFPIARGAPAENFSFSHDVGAIRHAEGLAHVVIGDEDADAAPAQIENHTLNIVYGLGVDRKSTRLNSSHV